MKKTLIIIGIVSAVVLLPVLGMAISPTRDLLLGLTPDDQILTLADKIDESRVSNEQTDSKIAELQSVIDSQKAELSNYQQQVEAQNTQIKSVKSDIQETQVKVDNEKKSECQKELENLNKAIKNKQENISRTDVSDSYIEGNKQDLQKLLQKKEQLNCN